MSARSQILDLMLEARRPLSGARIGEICRIGSWRLYPALSALEHDELIESEWEEEIVPGTPRRRLYRVGKYVP